MWGRAVADEMSKRRQKSFKGNAEVRRISESAAMGIDGDEQLSR